MGAALVVQGSSSPFPADTPTSLDLWGLGINGSLYQGIAFLCIIQIVYDINALLRRLQKEVEPEADDVLADMEPLFDDSEYFADAIFDRLLYIYLAGQGLLYGFTVHMFTNMAMYLQRMAIGTWVTGFVNAYNTLPVWLLCIYAAWAIFILATIIMHVLAINDEDLAEKAEARRREVTRQQQELAGFIRRLREELALDNEALGEGEAHQEEEARLRRQLIGALLAVDDEALAEREIRRQLGEGQPPPRARSHRTSLHNTIVWEVQIRAIVLSVGAVIEGIKLLVPRRYAVQNMRLLCPEFAALWSEDERAHFYTDLLTGGPASSALGAVLVEQGALRLGDYEDLWQRAELTMAVGISGSGMSSGMMSVLGKIASALVHVLERALGACVVVGVIVVIYLKCPQDEKT